MAPTLQVQGPHPSTPLSTEEMALFWWGFRQWQTFWELLQPNLPSGFLKQCFHATTQPIVQWLWDPETPPPIPWLGRSYPEEMGCRIGAYEAPPTLEGFVQWLQADCLGGAWEDHLNQTAHGQNNGIYLTPTPMAQTVAERALSFAPPTLQGRGAETGGMSVGDFACGTGRLLLPFLKMASSQDSPSPSENEPKKAGITISKLVYGDEHPLAFWFTTWNLTLAIGYKAAILGEKDTPQLMGHVGNSLLSFQNPHSIDGELDIIVENPPYLGEKGNKSLFQALLNQAPQWKPFYQGRMDYAYFFFDLALDKLRDGGTMAFLTTRYWLTSHSGQGLRQRLAEGGQHLGIFELAEQTVFRRAPGQHNLIFCLQTRETAKAETPPTYRWETPPSKTLPGTAPSNPSRWTAQGSTQSFIAPSGIWIQPSTGHREEILRRLGETTIPLHTAFHSFQGIISGADRLLAKHQKQYPEALGHLKVGTGIFCLSPEEATALDWPQTMKTQFLKPFSKLRHMSGWELPLFPQNPQSYQDPQILYLDHDTVLPEDHPVLLHLAPFRRILESRRECQQGKIPWYSLHWPRIRDVFENPCVVTSRRSALNHFLYAPQGGYLNSDFTLIHPIHRENPPLCLLTLQGLLNSDLLDGWMALFGKPKGAIREYFAGPLKGIPLPTPKSPGWKLLPEIKTLVQDISRYCAPSHGAVWHLNPQHPLWSENPTLDTQKTQTLQRELNHLVWAVYGIPTQLRSTTATRWWE